MKGVVDRIEEGKAVILSDDGGRTVRPASGLHEGDVLEIGEDGGMKINGAETRARRAEAERIHKRTVRRSLDIG